MSSAERKYECDLASEQGERPRRETRGVPMIDISELQLLLRAFAAERDWERLQTPKNLTMALAGEVGELAAVLQWTDGDDSFESVRGGGGLRDEFADEMADVMIYLARLADVAQLDLADAVASKMARNADRFPPSARP